MEPFSEFLADEDATLAMGSRLAAVCRAGLVIFLQGNLGAGKTTLTRGLLHGLGYQGRVKSPTYTLMEPYQFEHQGESITVYHFDLYRLADPEELEYLGGRDYFDGHALCLLEWPERGKGWLPPADLVIELVAEGDGRRVNISATGPGGREVLPRIRPQSSV